MKTIGLGKDPEESLKKEVIISVVIIMKKIFRKKSLHCNELSCI